MTRKNGLSKKFNFHRWLSYPGSGGFLFFWSCSLQSGVAGQIGNHSKKMGNFVFNYNKNDLQHWKTYKKPHIRLSNSEFDSSNSLWVIAVLNVKIGSNRGGKMLWVRGWKLRNTFQESKES
jgi:hypothetical protein